MEEQYVPKKSFLEKLAPIILIFLVIFIGYFAYTKLAPNFNFGATGTSGVPVVSQTLIQVDVGFLNSESFTNLKFISDDSSFDKVQGEILKGKSDPFAPVY
ncbi:MAG: hypothetical protein PHD31_02925 [Candidatus Pacebacteria bacterium]|nr:hypothetical protein [Candidatus Paceibacterota bacterium]